MKSARENFNTGECFPCSGPLTRGNLICLLRECGGGSEKTK